MTDLLLRRPLGLPRLAPYLLTLRRCATNGSPYRGDLNRDGILSGSLGSGEHVRSVVKQYQIFLPTQNVYRYIPLTQLKVMDNPCKLSIMMAQCHVFDDSSTKYLDSYEHPFAKSVLDIYIKKKENPLWHKVFSHPVAKPFPCRVAVKRIRHAFLDALAHYGYDRDGRKTTKDESSVITALKGSVKISCGDPKAACNTKFADLFEQIKLVVAGLEPFLAVDKNGEYVMAPQQKANKPQSKQNWKSNNQSSKSNKFNGNRKTGTRPGNRPGQ
ncbi:hypothetical protein F4805DRAFT_428807 [Annulohypoxylon moriforme]|nr:hypothetical protein F4805DRAFT_428807 [Annulohypoxylon moriforme]